MHKNLGDHPIQTKRFPHLDAVFNEFRKKDFLSLSDRKRSEKVNAVLYQLIAQESEPCFLLSAVLGFIEKVDQEKILEHYTLTSFELWLNQYSKATPQENARIRGKIVGKWIDRGDYQAVFPISMGKVYEGTHFVTAHKSPDLDTTVASFWGWMDAFAARVGDGLHVWNLPGGPTAQVEIDLLFRDIFGSAVFTHLAKTRTVLHLTGNDLMTQKELMRATLSDSIGSIDHERGHKAVVVVDSDGFYLGDWRHLDVEEVRQVIILLSTCIHWFENNLHLQLISLLAQKDLYYADVAPRLKKLFELKLEECEPALSFSRKEKKHIHDLVAAVLGIKEGVRCTFESLGQHLAKICDIPFDSFVQISRAMQPLFDGAGRLLERRSDIFGFLETTIRNLHQMISKIRERLERFDIAIKVKFAVFNHHPTFVTVRSNVDEIRTKMGTYQSLTVVYPDKDHYFPVGTIHAQDLRKELLGTVSLRDFCNLDEMTIPPYLEVISVIDHHKAQLKTLAPPLAMIADVQSSNTLVANLAFAMNDRYSLGGQSLEQIEEQIQQAKNDFSSQSNRLLQRLLKRQYAAVSKASCYIDPIRERVEYLHFLYAILEDTDLLSKVTAPDVECVVSLLNRLQSLILQKEVEVLSLDELPRDAAFPKKAAKKILQNDEMYSLYRKVYAHKEKEVEHNLELCAQGKPSTIFVDTKEQNGCCRIGQTKIFASNVPFFFTHVDAIRHVWYETAIQIFRKKTEILLHMHMFSTLVSAEEVYKGQAGSYNHKDELWIWIPKGESSVELLKRFLHNFQNSPGLKENPLEVDFLGDNASELALIFKESFFDIPQKSMQRNLPIAVLRFKAGMLNSRKAMVTPFLPIATL